MRYLTATQPIEYDRVAAVFTSFIGVNIQIAVWTIAIVFLAGTTIFIFRAAKELSYETWGHEPGILDKLLWTAFGIMSFATVLTFGAGVFTAQNSLANDQADDARRITQHQVKVEKWLRSDYGITVDQAAAHDLIAGKSLVVTRDGADILIELTPRADKGLAVRVPAGALLQPNGTK